MTPDEIANSDFEKIIKNKIRPIVERVYHDGFSQIGYGYIDIESGIVKLKKQINDLMKSYACEQLQACLDKLPKGKVIDEMLSRTWRYEIVTESNASIDLCREVIEQQIKELE
jgi:hypothetical protein